MALPLAIASGVMGFVGAIQQGNAAEASAKANAQALREQRKQDIQTAQIAAEDQNRENRRRLSAYRAAYGSSGIELAGSPLDVLSDTSMEMALDSRRIEYEGQVRGRESESRARLAIMEGKAAKKASRISAFSSLLSAGSGYANASMAGG